MDGLLKHAAFRAIGDAGASRRPSTEYVPWMQATYIMAANKKALQYLPKGANLKH